MSEEWPKPRVHNIMDPTTKQLVALSEVERRQHYIDKMIGDATKLREMVESCLDDDPDQRPSIHVVSAIIESLKVSIKI